MYCLMRKVLPFFSIVAGEMDFTRLTGEDLDFISWTAIVLGDRRVGAGDFSIFEIKN